MRCLNPIKAGYTVSGELTFKKKEHSQELEGFELECRKCLPCRLNIAREKSIRALHESKMHEHNIFLTLTYNEENLKSSKLQYKDFQLFMYSLRELRTRHIKDKELKKKFSISYMVTGEYGAENKRPHWHAILFNYRPSDAKHKYTTELGEDVYTSEEISNLWKKGNIEFGSVTLDSASYVARYAAKKLVHGHDADHDYHPIHKTSSKYAIGRSWIEKYFEHAFNHGFIVLPNGQTTKIPRYYVDWAKKHKPEVWQRYVTQKRHELQEEAKIRSRKEELLYLTDLINQQHGGPRPITRAKVKLTILKQKFKKLQEKLKL